MRRCRITRRLKLTCAFTSAFASHLTRPFRIMCTASMPCKGAPCRGKRAVSFRQPSPLFHGAMVLFHHIVEVVTLGNPDLIDKVEVDLLQSLLAPPRNVRPLGFLVGVLPQPCHASD